MFILMLDVDGVLCTLRSHLAFHGRGGSWKDFDPVSCKLLKRLLDNFNGKIVVSSVWRFDHWKDELFKQLEKHELLSYLHTDWRTGRMPGIRGVEIKDWLDTHESSPYLIIDDDDDFFDDQLKYHVLTDSSEGFGADNYLKAEELLKKSWSLESLEKPEIHTLTVKL